MTALLNNFNDQYETDLVQNSMTISLRVSGNVWSVAYRGQDTAFHGAQVYNTLTPNMTAAQCDTLAQTMLSEIQSIYPDV